MGVVTTNSAIERRIEPTLQEVKIFRLLTLDTTSTLLQRRALNITSVDISADKLVRTAAPTLR